MARQLSVGLLGCGEAGLRHAAILDDDVPSLVLSGVFDTSAGRCRRLASSHHVEALPSLEAFFAREFDVVIICTPNDTHAALACSALERGSHVILEHPLALTNVEAARVCRASHAHARQLFVVRQRRYSAIAQALRRVVAGGLLGQLEELSACILWSRSAAYFLARPWRRDARSGGVLMNQASHFIDLLLYVLGDWVEITGVRGALRHAVPVEDTAFGVMRFADGAKVDFFFSVACPDGVRDSELMIRGERGSIRLGGSEWSRIDEWSAPHRPSPGEIASARGDHREFLERVARRLNGDDVEVVDASEGARTVRAIEAFYRANPIDTRRTAMLIRSRHEHLEPLLAAS